MPLDLPREKKIYTTKYANFKGVDFTNDSTNVYYRRSPTAVNMIPSLDGKPFKRPGWETVCNKHDFINRYMSETGIVYNGDVDIRMLKHFELNGVSHVVIFTNIAVFLYRDDKLVFLTDDTDVIDSHDRNFFFEGNGTSAFYIFANYKIWAYEYADNSFTFTEKTPYVPTILIGQNANGTGGKLYEGVNLLSSKVKELFQNNAYVDGETTYNRVYLSASVSQSAASEVKVKVSVNTQFDTELNIVDESGEISDTTCKLNTPDSGHSYIEFNSAYLPIVEGEDCISVEYPVMNVSYNHYSEPTSKTREATLERS